MSRNGTTHGSAARLRQRPPVARTGFWRALGTSTSLHAAILGAGVALGLFRAGGEPRRVVSYSATFVPPAPTELRPEEPERLEPTLAEPDEAEPELRESEVWAESEPLFALAEPEPEAPPRARVLDWVAGHPFEIGTVSPTVSPEPATAPPTPTSAPSPPLASLEPQAAHPRRVSEPTPLRTPHPEYPRLSRRAGEEGSVLCRLQLGADGSVLGVEVVESSGHPRLDQAALAALAGWRFEPRREDGAPVAARILHRVTFRLRES